MPQSLTLDSSLGTKVLSQEEIKYFDRQLHMLEAFATQARRLVAAGSINRDVIRNLAISAEFTIVDIGKAAGVATDSEAELQKRFSALRDANTRISELEAQLAGSSTGALATQVMLRGLQASLSDWWRQHGLGHVKNLEFNPSAGNISLSCNLMGPSACGMTSNPSSAHKLHNQWLDEVRAKGFELIEPSHPLDKPMVADNERNRALIVRLMLDTFPSCSIKEFESKLMSDGKFVITRIGISISNYADLAHLSNPTSEI